MAYQIIKKNININNLKITYSILNNSLSEVLEINEKNDALELVNNLNQNSNFIYELREVKNTNPKNFVFNE